MKHISTLLLLCLGCLSLQAQRYNVNYDESKIGSYSLPDPLVCRDGTVVKSAAEWQSKRRPEILALFEEYMYGRTPDTPLPGMTFIVVSEEPVFEGKGVRKEVQINLSPDFPEFYMTVLMYLPAGTDGPVPVFIATNGLGNHELSKDPGITLTDKWVPDEPQYGVVDHRVTEASRGARAHRWPLELIIERGYGLATFYNGDIDLDRKDVIGQGVQRMFYADGQTRPEADEWGTLGVWAWGLSRCMDYFETAPEIDAERVIVFGHSRTGKAALWAGAQDERFAMVISNNSGCGGAAISRRNYGETLEIINTAFPHWFCDNFQEFNNRENELPVDQHMLIALIAPRPVYVASAEQDRWADPKGEFIAAKNASRVYNLYGLKGLENRRMPPLNCPIQEDIGYHIRTGGHDILRYDWECYLDFADKHLLGK